MQVRAIGSFIAAAASLLAQPASPVMVRLNLLALDSKGQPAADVTAAELHVTDQGKAQRIVYFHRKAPGELSNQKAPLPRTTVILLDLMNQGHTDALDACKQVSRSLQQLESGEFTYLYILGLDGNLVPIHPLPQDPWMSNADDKTWTKQIGSQFDKIMKSLGKVRPAGILQEEVVKKTYVALESLAKKMAAYSGERNIAWVMKDVPTVSNPKTPCNGDWLDCALYIPHLTVTLDRANVAVNTVTYANISDPNTNRGMVDFAGLLGGRPFFGDDIRTVLSKLATDPASGYTLGYELAPEDMDNRLRRTKVACDRKGVKIEVRQRYYAYPDNRQPAARAQEALMAAAASPFDDPQIGLGNTATPPTADKLHLQLRINTNDLLLHEDAGAFTDHLTILLVGYTDKGPTGSPVPTDIQLRLTKEQRDSAVKDGLPMTQDFPIDSTIRKVRFLLYDHATGAVGSLTVPAT